MSIFLKRSLLTLRQCYCCKLGTSILGESKATLSVSASLGRFARTLRWLHPYTNALVCSFGIKIMINNNLISDITIEHFHKVQPFLYRSAQPLLEEYGQLSALNITTIFNLRNELCGTPLLSEIDHETRRLGIKHVHIPLCSSPPPANDFKNYLDTIRRATNSGEAVLVHCAAGMDRTGFMIGAYRAIEENWSFEATYNEMLHYQFHTCFLEFSTEIRRLTSKSKTAGSSTSGCA